LLLFGHTLYTADPKANQQQYPFRKYDITGGQIKDALMGLVANPRPFLVDTCYIYLFGMGRLAFELNPSDPFLVQQGDALPEKKENLSLYQENQLLKLQLANLEKTFSLEHGRSAARNRIKRWLLPIVSAMVILLALCGFLFYRYQSLEKTWETAKNDFNLLPYRVTDEERRQLEGIWICYTGSPQARLSDSNRYHKVVANLIQIDYKDGYFLYNRFGASFNHIGYIQFEAPGLLSIHSRVKNNNGKVESPRHSLMMLDSTGTYLSAISASWNFDVGDRNRIIGIREAYQKLGSGGTLEEVINSLENASCQCKILRWRKPNDSVSTYYLKNISLDALKDSSLLQLINEHSILTKNPSEKLVIEDSQD
jgi:hypothetical protein